jgi:hypothetical protein
METLASLDDIELKEKTPEEKYYVSRLQKTKSSSSIQLENIATQLPYDILHKIYKDHFSPETVVISHLMKMIESKECQDLHYFELGDYLEKSVLPNPVVVKKLQKENPLFAQLYQEEIVRGKKHFARFESTYYSFALAWLMFLYH